MNTLDFAPLLRTAIGFDRLARTLETARASQDPQGYPPYNIEKVGEDSNVLTVAGRAPQAEEGRSFLHRGIAGRAFERRFALADHIVVDGANLEHGLLQLALKRVVPEALKPRRIPVQPGRPAIANEGGQDQAPQAQAA